MSIRNRIIILVVIIVVLAHFVFTSSREPGVRLPVTDKFVMKIYSPVLKGLNRTKFAVAHFFDDYFFLVSTAKQNRSLTSTVERLLIENQSLKTRLDSSREHERVAEKYQYYGYELLLVNQIAFDPLQSSKTIVVNAGSTKGVTLDAVVVSGLGLVGRVIEVFDKSSKVLLVIDPYFSVDTFNQRTGLRALVQGLPQSELAATPLPFLSQIAYFEKGRDTSAGDVLITSGLGGVYPQGIPVGEIVALPQTDNLVQSIVVRPRVDFTRITALFVLVKSAASDQ